jgi:cell division protein FtsW
MVMSASMEIAGTNLGQPFYYAIRHLIYMSLGIIAAIVVLQIPMSFWQKYDWLFLLIGFLLLVLVVVPGIGRTVNGSSRWIALGPINLQSSELAKLFMVIYLAGYLVRRQAEVRSQWSGFMKPFAILAVMIVLLLMEPDFGAVVVTMIAALGMLFLGGVRAGQFFLTIAGSLIAIGIMASSQTYRMQRLTAYADPWAPENVFSGGYQLTQSLIAFGRGDWFGVGLGNSMQKLFYLPEAHTDFVFAILAEETGLMGSLLVVVLLSLVIWRAMQIGRSSELAGKFFSAYVAFGIALIMASQSLINIGVNTGLLPTKGLTLPFLSYGGSSLIVCCISIAILLRIDYETRQETLND